MALQLSRTANGHVYRLLPPIENTEKQNNED
jgi:hypothetical protein